MLARFLALGSCGLILFSLCGLLATSALAVVDIYEFDTASQRERYFQLSEELRCPKCQNQNLAGSDSQIAGDLRRELRRLLEEGKTDREIKRFMVDRYGEFVLYNPPLQKSTVVLWGLPFLLFLIGVTSVLVLVKRRKASKVGGASGDTLSSEEKQTLDDLLDKER
jgi:cytochrome c-type biogenesis protein CcmH